MFLPRGGQIDPQLFLPGLWGSGRGLGIQSYWKGWRIRIGCGWYRLILCKFLGCSQLVLQSLRFGLWGRGRGIGLVFGGGVREVGFKRTVASLAAARIAGRFFKLVSYVAFTFFSSFSSRSMSTFGVCQGVLTGITSRSLFFSNFTFFSFCTPGDADVPDDPWRCCLRC